VAESHLQRCPDAPTALKLYSQAEEKLQNAASFSATDVAPRVTLGDALSGHGERMHAGENSGVLSISGARVRMFLTWMVNQKKVVVKCKMSILKWAPGHEGSILVGRTAKLEARAQWDRASAFCFKGLEFEGSNPGPFTFSSR
jgi:hypothetical protein